VPRLAILAAGPVAGLTAVALAIAPPAPAAAQKIEACYVGQRVKTPGGRVGTVTAAKGAGCTVHRDGDAPAVTDTWGAFMLTPVAGSPVRNPPVSRALPLGEYACYGVGQRVLAGMGFKLQAGGRYTDLDGKSAGRWAVKGADVHFTGGHLAGQVGRDIKDRGFTFGQAMSCQLWG
jgi:hypothetical protein